MKTHIQRCSLAIIPNLKHNLNYSTEYTPISVPLPDLSDFPYNRLNQFIPPLHHPTLATLASIHNVRYASSTSSFTCLVSQLIMNFSRNRQIDFFPSPSAYYFKPKTLTLTCRSPTSCILTRRDNTYIISIEKPAEENPSILSKLGNSLELYLLSTPSEFSSFLNGKQLKTYGDDGFEFTKFDKFLIRSQIDMKQDTNLIDLKTRATYPIRMDIENYTKYLDYEIKTTLGTWFSWEREYFDLSRSAFLKWSLQARFGNMHGMYVVYHNTRKLMGTQFISVDTMDQVLFGSTFLANKFFENSIVILGELFDLAIIDTRFEFVRVTVDQRNKRYVDVYFEFMDKLHADAITAKHYRIELYCLVDGEQYRHILKIDEKSDIQCSWKIIDKGTCSAEYLNIVRESCSNLTASTRLKSESFLEKMKKFEGSGLEDLANNGIQFGSRGFKK